MKTTWEKDVRFPEGNPLPGDATADVAIIGCGMTGTLCAYLLSKAGKSVIVIDKGVALEKSATVCTTAFLSTDVDTALSDLETMFGKKHAHNVWLSGEDAIKNYEKIIEEEKIECDFMRVPEYWYATGKDGLASLRDEAKRGKAAGFMTSALSKDDFNFKTEGGYIFPDQAKFHPLKFLSAIRAQAEEYGAKFFGRTEAKDIRGNFPVTIVTERGEITASYVIIATYLSIENPPSIFAKKGMYTSYVYELSIPRGTLPEGLYLDDLNPYHYFRIDAGEGQGDEDRMIIGGEDHRKELPVKDERQFDALESYIKKTFPKLKYKITTRWSGPILETLDGLPYIGVPSKNNSHHLVATGFSGNGMTYAMTAANILTGIILEKKNKYEDTFSPHREVTLSGILYKTRDYLVEFGEGYLKNLFT